MRVFIAALLPDEIKDHIESYVHSIRSNIMRVKWEKPEKLHITLKFLGDIDDKQLNEVNDIVFAAVADISKINLSLTNFGAFPSLSRPRVLYVGFSASEAISDLQGIIDAGLLEAGFDKEQRKFIPHVTIGRVKSGFKLAAPLPIIEEKKLVIDKIAVVRSFINTKGSEYKNLSVYELN
ncbi:MAG: RNA 2',3'-cyclic phosphodiesterase [Candidatus Dadabacteria bacterium]|nr:RNA 2',3'-cyclic phosphodiesterase [Candidatus Dadabacteria bacterium]NIS08937.1 RNA 2',3'-cyclic phosphodiesterase [Candidatus Dadabacteria bacterium]NIV40839.1 RNA 2',3'-cyclic phosphodiesterase [Candidatus Dadabacteria bacterium]NIX15487.1 RNA 2',3'-cyclic phosphodiesterase [Candidatus Dadabacteria bacterium]NIY22808.1 RNA 2',3'-cyclic phosphodiesterase [Candidatus Dadabacteria bacterium]